MPDSLNHTKKSGTSVQPTNSSDPQGGVIWISGYSSAGKTTVGRIVDSKLRHEGQSTVFLDGDDLRSIFSGKWGYQREDRVELARVYFKLCSHLASQGHIVVIAAVAMFDEARQWLRENVPKVLEVFLDVPESERKRRDAQGKNVYPAVGDVTGMYDEPSDTALRLKNFGDVAPESLANEILAQFGKIETRSVTYGRNEHWRAYYSKARVPAAPSPFALLVGQSLPAASRLLEIGCGNGRDSAYFASQGHQVVALDASEAAVELSRSSHTGLSIEFHAGTLPALASKLTPFDAIYTRFVLHAMPVQEEVETLAAASSLLKPDGHIFIECRSINDPMARLGEVISPTERIHGHYRRFIIKDELLERLRNSGFEPIDVIESNGLAVHGNEDPVVIRVTARK